MSAKTISFEGISKICADISRNMASKVISNTFIDFPGLIFTFCVTKGRIDQIHFCEL